MKDNKCPCSKPKCKDRICKNICEEYKEWRRDKKLKEV